MSPAGFYLIRLLPHSPRLGPEAKAMDRAQVMSTGAVGDSILVADRVDRYLAQKKRGGRWPPLRVAKLPVQRRQEYSCRAVRSPSPPCRTSRSRFGNYYSPCTSPPLLLTPEYISLTGSCQANRAYSVSSV